MLTGWPSAGKNLKTPPPNQPNHMHKNRTRVCVQFNINQDLYTFCHGNWCLSTGGYVDLDLNSRSQQYETGSMAVYACRLLWCVKGDEGRHCGLLLVVSLDVKHHVNLLAPGIRPTWCWTEWVGRSSTLTLATALRWPWRGRSSLRRYPSVSPACWSMPWRSESAPLASLSLLLIEMSSS